MLFFKSMYVCVSHPCMTVGETMVLRTCWSLLHCFLLPFLVLPQDCGVWRSLPYVLQGHPNGSGDESFGHEALSVPAG